MYARIFVVLVTVFRFILSDGRSFGDEYSRQTPLLLWRLRIPFGNRLSDSTKDAAADGAALTQFDGDRLDYGDGSDGDLGLYDLGTSRKLKETVLMKRSKEEVEPNRIVKQVRISNLHFNINII